MTRTTNNNSGDDRDKLRKYNEIEKSFKNNDLEKLFKSFKTRHKIDNRGDDNSEK